MVRVVALTVLTFAACTSTAGSVAPTGHASDETPPRELPPIDGAVADGSPGDASSSADASPPSIPGAPFPVEGYGKDTHGGFVKGHSVYHVTSLADDGAGSLRVGLATGNAPRVILFDVDGEIIASSAFIVPSNVTIDGRGHEITIKKRGFVLGGSDEVIVTNVALADIGPNTEDGVQIGSAPDPSEHVVLDHVAFRQTGDGGDSKNVDEALSVVFGSRFITVQWCRFEGWEKVMLFGNGDAPAALDAQLRITVHHSYARNTGRRHPQARHGVFDFFNNEWDDWHMYGWAWESPYRESFGAQAQDGAQVLFENNIARRTVHSYDAFSEANDVTRCESGGIVDEHGTWIPSDSTAPLVIGTGCPPVKTPLTRPYPASLEPADAKLRQRLETLTGNVLH